MNEDFKIDNFGIPLEEMARVWPQESGLPMAIFISNGEGLSHGPRIKVSAIMGGRISANALVSVTIDDSPQFIGDLSDQISTQDKHRVIEFIRRNKQTLIDHFYGKISDKQALNQIQSV